MTKFQFIQKIREDGYPKIVIISSRNEHFKIDRKDPNFENPISNLNKSY